MFHLMKTTPLLSLLALAFSLPTYAGKHNNKEESYQEHHPKKMRHTATANTKAPSSPLPIIHEEESPKEGANQESTRMPVSNSKPYETENDKPKDD